MSDDRQVATIKRYDGTKGFGFLRRPGGADLFFHVREVLNGEEAALEPGVKLTFAIGEDRNGRPCAVEVDFAR